MSFTPIKSHRAYAQVVEQIIDLVKKGVFPPGSQLPSERELAERLAISRATLREALSALQMLGLVETKHGQGTFVSAEKLSPGIRFDASWLYDEESPFTLLQARKAVEPPIAALAATQRTEDDLSRLREIQGYVQSDPQDLRRFSQGDRKFHLAIAQATGNPVLIGIMSFVHELMGQELWQRLMMATSFATVGRWQQAADEHWGLYEAIKGRDGALAAERMRRHLARVEEVMIEADLGDANGLPSNQDPLPSTK